MASKYSGGKWQPAAPRRKAPTRRIRKAFDPDALRRVCELREVDFPDAYGLTRHDVRSERVYRDPDGDGEWYAFRDNGASILAVAHLDTVVGHAARKCVFAETASGTVCHSGALDDRLGAYTILHLLPALGVDVDVLLTTGEESGMSTASFFDPPNGKEYDWVIEFDRGGNDVVMYQFEDNETVELVENSGAIVGIGSFSDIAYLDHLEVKAFNWGTGYTGPGHNYHSPRAHVWLDDYFQNVAYFLNFHADNAGTYLPHDGRDWGNPLGRRTGAWDDDWDDWRGDAYADVVDGDVVDAELVLDRLADAYVHAVESGDADAIEHARARVDALADLAAGDGDGERDDDDGHDDVHPWHAGTDAA